MHALRSHSRALSPLSRTHEGERPGQRARRPGSTAGWPTPSRASGYIHETLKHTFSHFKSPLTNPSLPRFVAASRVASSRETLNHRRHRVKTHALPACAFFRRARGATGPPSPPRRPTSPPAAGPLSGRCVGGCRRPWQAGRPRAPRAPWRAWRCPRPGLAAAQARELFPPSPRLLPPPPVPTPGRRRTCAAPHTHVTTPTPRRRGLIPRGGRARSRAAAGVRAHASRAGEVGTHAKD